MSGLSLSVITREGSCCQGSSNVSQKTLSPKIKLKRLDYKIDQNLARHAIYKGHLETNAEEN